MTTMKERIAEAQITSKVEAGAPYNPEFPDSDDWTVTLRRGRHFMKVPFYMGRGLNGREPSVEDVLDSLCLDASGYVDAQDFEDWCSQYGYDSDSRKAHRIYTAVGKATLRLRKLLGDHYELFLYETESL